MMTIKRRRKKNNNDDDNDDKIIITLRQEIKQIIDIIGHKNDPLYRDGCTDEIIKVLEKYLDYKIEGWQQAFEHHQQKEEEWKYKGNYELSDIHHSMKIYSNGAAHGLQFFKDELS